MPLAAQRAHHRLHHGPLALPALPAVPLPKAAHTPRVPILLNKSRALIERIPALGAEKVSLVPCVPARDDDFSFDGRGAGFAARGEELVEIEVAVELYGGGGGVAGGGFEAFAAGGGGFGEEAGVFEGAGAMGAAEAGGVEPEG